MAKGGFFNLGSFFPGWEEVEVRFPLLDLTFLNSGPGPCAFQALGLVPSSEGRIGKSGLWPAFLLLLIKNGHRFFHSLAQDFFDRFFRLPLPFFQCLSFLPFHLFEYEFF